MAKVAMLHFPDGVLDPVLGPYRRRIFGHALFDFRRLLIPARRRSGGAGERDMLHILHFEILVFHQMDSSIDQNSLDLARRRYVLFDPKGGDTFFDRLSCQLDEIELFTWIHLNDVDLSRYVAE